MSETEGAMDRRAEIALRSHRRRLEGRLHKLTMSVGSLMAYSAFGNIVGGIMLLASSPWGAVMGFVLSGLYVFGTYRVWSKDDVRWWPVAVPAGITIGVLLLAWIGGVLHPVPLLLNAVLLVLVPIRASVGTSLAAMSDRSSNMAPLRGSV